MVTDFRPRVKQFGHRGHKQTQAPMLDVKVLRIEPSPHGGAVKATASVEYYGLSIHNLEIIDESGKAPWIFWPTRQTKSGDYDFICRPVAMSAKRAIETAIFRAWEEVAV